MVDYGELQPAMASCVQLEYGFPPNMPFFPESTEGCLIVIIFVKLYAIWDIYVFLDSFFRDNFSLLLEVFFILFINELFQKWLTFSYNF